MERVQPRHPDFVLRRWWTELSRRLRCPEDQGETGLGGTELVFRPERDVNLQARRKQEHPIQDAAGHHIEVMSDMVVSVQLCGPTVSDVCWVSVGTDLEDEVDVGPDVLVPSTSRSDKGRTYDIVIGSRVLDQGLT